MARLFAGVVALWVVLFALVWDARPAFADPDGAPAAPPRDVVLFVQPSEVKLPAPPGDFERIERGWLTLEFPASTRNRVEDLVRDAEEFRARLSEELGQPLLDHAVLRIARSPEQIAELAPEGAPLIPYATGITYPSFQLMILALQAPGTWEAPDLGELMRHELTHLALSEAVAGHHVPKWFNEGLAIYESGEFPWARRMALAEASFGRRLLPLSDLDGAFPEDRYAVNVAYAESAGIVAFLLRDSDRARFGSLIERVRAGVVFDRALEDAYGIDSRKLEFEWREEVSRHFSIVPALTGGGLVWVLATALAAVAWVKRRRRARAKLDQWAREEAEMEAAVAAAAARPSDEGATASPTDDMPSGPKPGIPVVEHEGRWYTVH
jgi:hypothetical protein